MMVMIIPIVIIALGIVLKGLEKRVKEKGNLEKNQDKFKKFVKVLVYFNNYQICYRLNLNDIILIIFNWHSFLVYITL